jgi:hypothetical protein
MSSQVYNGLTAVAVVNPGISQLTITPATQPIEEIGPDGKTIQYSFSIQSVAAPPGTYTIDLEILAGGVVAATSPEQLTVTSS